MDDKLIDIDMQTEILINAVQKYDIKLKLLAADKNNLSSNFRHGMVCARTKILITLLVGVGR
jgi:hypothetical protein